MIESRISNFDIPSSVIFDRRSLISSARIIYHNIHKFRIFQMNQGVDLRTLTDEQWGLQQLDKCHHISTTSTSKDGPQSFRVRICKTCCQEETHIELGTYVDQESAILVNDTFEILNNRLNRLIVLKRQDKPYLNYLMAKKYDRSKGRDYGSILDLIEERVSAIDDKKKQKYQQLRASSDCFNAVGVYNNRHYPTATVVSSEDIVSVMLPYEQETDLAKNSRFWGTGSIDDSLIYSGVDLGVGNNHIAYMSDSAAPWNHLYQSNSCHYNKISSKKNKLINVHYTDENQEEVQEDEDGDEEGNNAQDVSLLTTDRSTSFKQQAACAATVANSSEQETLETILALKRLSTVCTEHFAQHHQQKNTIEYNTMSSNLVSISPSSPHSSVILGDSDISVHDIELETSFITIENKATKMMMHECQYISSEEVLDHSTTNLKRSHTSNTTSADMSPRKRAATFSVNKPYHFPEVEYYKNNTEDDSMIGAASSATDSNDKYMLCKTKEPFQYNSKTPIATLTWLASMEDDEVDVAKSLYELRGCFNTNAFTTNTMNNLCNPNTTSIDEMNNSSIVGGTNNSNSSSSKDNKALHSHMKGRPRSNSMPLLPNESRNNVLHHHHHHHGQRMKRGDENILNKKNHPDINNSSSRAAGFVGIYSPEHRRIRLQRFWDKRNCRMWTKKVKYDVRKNFADSRIRVKGRFVKKLDEANFQINDEDDNANYNNILVVQDVESNYNNHQPIVDDEVNDETQSIFVNVVAV